MVRKLKLFMCFALACAISTSSQGMMRAASRVCHVARTAKAATNSSCARVISRPQAAAARVARAAVRAVPTPQAASKCVKPLGFALAAAPLVVTVAGQESEPKKIAEKVAPITFTAEYIKKFPQYEKDFIKFAQASITSKNESTVLAIVALIETSELSVLSLLADGIKNIEVSDARILDALAKKSPAFGSMLKISRDSSAQTVHKKDNQAIEPDQEKKKSKLRQLFSKSNIVNYGVIPTAFTMGEPCVSAIGERIYAGHMSDEALAQVAQAAKVGLPISLASGIMQAIVVDLVTDTKAGEAVKAYLKCPSKEKKGKFINYSCETAKWVAKTGITIYTNHLITKYMVVPTLQQLGVISPAQEKSADASDNSSQSGDTSDNGSQNGDGE